MGNSIKNKSLAYAPAIISGLLTVLAFPSFDLYLLAWISFTPLLYSLWGKNPREAFLSGFVFGIAYFFGTLYWIYHSINHYGGFSFLSSIAIVLLLCGYLSLYPALFSYLFSMMIEKTKLPALFIAPVLWVVLEFLRSYMLTGFPWSSIGYSQHKFLPIIQIADITGIYGISFLIIAVNGAIVDLFLLKKRLKKMPLFPLSYTIVGFSVLLLTLFAVTGYGIWRLNQERTGSPVRIGIVQGNIEQDHKWDLAYQNQVMNIYKTLSAEVSLSSPDLIVWPETSVPFYFQNDRAVTDKFLEFQRGLGSHLLFGTVTVKEMSREKVLLSNSAVLLDKEGNTVYQYDKIHLVPFGEYVPLKKFLFFMDKLVTGIGDYVPGDTYLQAKTDFGNFGTLICYEIIFPGMVRKFYANEEGDFITTMTNDAWFGNTSGPYQHFSMAVFRALENRKPMVRAANTGISGFIDSNGKILSRSSLFERQILEHTITTDATVTFYTRYGDLFSYFCIVLTVILFINTRFWR